MPPISNFDDKNKRESQGLKPTKKSKFKPAGHLSEQLIPDLNSGGS